MLFSNSQWPPTDEFQASGDTDATDADCPGNVDNDACVRAIVPPHGERRWCVRESPESAYGSRPVVTAERPWVDLGDRPFVVFLYHIGVSFSGIPGKTNENTPRVLRAAPLNIDAETAMRTFTVTWCSVGVAALAAILLASAGEGPVLLAQNRSGDGAADTKSLDVQLERIQEQYVRETARLAEQYEQAGDLEKAKQVLQSILKVRPDLPPVEEKIKELDEAILSQNKVEVRIDVSRGWGPPVGRVFEGRRLRIRAEGEYRFRVNRTLGPDGFPTKQPENGDMARGIPCGALMGMVVTQDESGDPKTGDPIKIGTGRVYTPKQDGLLFLRVNVPPGHESHGRIDLTVSGHMAPAGNR